MGIARKSSRTFAARVLGLAFATFSAILIARLAGTEGRGEYAGAFLVADFAGMFLAFYVSGSVIYWLGQRKYDDSTVLGTATAFMLIVSALGLAAYLAFVLGTDNEITRSTSRLNLIVVGVTIPFVLVPQVWQGALLSKETVWPQNVSVAIGPALGFALLGVLCLTGTDYVHYAVIAKSAMLIGSGLFFYFVARRCFAIRLRISRAALGDLLRYGLYGHLSMILGFVMYRVDMFFVLAITGKKQLGLYSTAVTLAELLWFAPAAIAMLVFPRTANQDLPSAAEAAAKGSRHSILLAAAGALAYLVAGDWLIWGLFGREFLPAYWPLALLLPGIVINATGKSTAAFLAGRGRVRSLLALSTIACIVNIVLNVLLIPTYGIGGAAVATTISYALASLIGAVFFVRASGLPLSALLVPTREDIAAYRRLVFSR